MLNADILAHCRIPQAKVHIPLLEIIPPIRRKYHRLPTSTLDGERRHKNQQFRAPADGRRENIVVLQEPERVALAHVELDYEADDEVHHNGGVDANGEVTEVPADDGCDDVVDAIGGEVPM